MLLHIVALARHTELVSNFINCHTFSASGNVGKCRMPCDCTAPQIMEHAYVDSASEGQVLHHRSWNTHMWILLQKARTGSVYIPDIERHEH
jgi:hypothetical protein